VLTVGGSIQIGRILGIPVRVHITFLILVRSSV